MARKDNADAPQKKSNWFKQVGQAFNLTRQTDPQVVYWVFGAIAAVLALAVIVGMILNRLTFTLFIGVPLALLAGMLLLVRRAEAAAYQRLGNRPGAALSALETVRTGSWTFEPQPVESNAKTGEMLFRGVGRAGILLVSEGGSGQRAARLVENETRRIKRVVPEAPITVLRVGDEEGDVALPKLSRKVTRLKPILSKEETAAVTSRLKALGPKKLPTPKGVDPFRARPNRKALRGR